MCLTKPPRNKKQAPPGTKMGIGENAISQFVNSSRSKLNWQSTAFRTQWTLERETQPRASRRMRRILQGDKMMVVGMDLVARRAALAVQGKGVRST